MPREKPLNRIHVENMLEVTDAGGISGTTIRDFGDRNDGLDETIEDSALEALGFMVDTSEPGQTDR